MRVRACPNGDHGTPPVGDNMPDGYSVLYKAGDKAHVQLRNRGKKELIVSLETIGSMSMRISEENISGG